MDSVAIVAGTRPNFMKVGPIIRAFKEEAIRPILIHTGQHYDDEMSGVFLRELGIPTPDVTFHLKERTELRQIGEMLQSFDEVMADLIAQVVVVVGDVSSTLAAAIAAKKRGKSVVHVEAGLRSFDMTMPEEVNRVVVDRISDLLLTSSPEAEDNLVREGIPANSIVFTGNVMIDSLKFVLGGASTRWDSLREKFHLDGNFVLATFHRPSNVDHYDTFSEIAQALVELSKTIPVLFPVHPRTMQRNRKLLNSLPEEVKLCGPLGYVDFVCLQKHARLVLTDSGGVQEETTFLETPCVTVRNNTERPITLMNSANELVRPECNEILSVVDSQMMGDRKWNLPPLWDGMAGQRIVKAILEHFE